MSRSSSWLPRIANDAMRRLQRREQLGDRADVGAIAAR